MARSAVPATRTCRERMFQGKQRAASRVLGQLVGLLAVVVGEEGEAVGRGRGAARGATRAPAGPPTVDTIMASGSCSADPTRLARTTVRNCSMGSAARSDSVEALRFQLGPVLVEVHGRSQLVPAPHRHTVAAGATATLAPDGDGARRNRLRADGSYQPSSSSVGRCVVDFRCDPPAAGVSDQEHDVTEHPRPTTRAVRCHLGRAPDDGAGTTSPWAPRTLDGAAGPGCGPGSGRRPQPPAARCAGPAAPRPGPAPLGAPRVRWSASWPACRRGRSPRP